MFRRIRDAVATRSSRTKAIKLKEMTRANAFFRGRPPTGGMIRREDERVRRIDRVKNTVTGGEGGSESSAVQKNFSGLRRAVSRNHFLTKRKAYRREEGKR